MRNISLETCVGILRVVVVARDSPDANADSATIDAAPCSHVDMQAAVTLRVGDGAGTTLNLQRL